MGMSTQKERWKTQLWPPRFLDPPKSNYSISSMQIAWNICLHCRHVFCTMHSNSPTWNVWSTQLDLWILGQSKHVLVLKVALAYRAELRSSNGVSKVGIRVIKSVLHPTFLLSQTEQLMRHHFDQSDLMFSWPVYTRWHIIGDAELTLEIKSN